MVTRQTPLDRDSWRDPGWFPAGQVALDGGRRAAVSFNRYGDGRLSLALDHGPDGDDLAVLDDAAGVLPHLRLGDLGDVEELRKRHADYFDLSVPLPHWRFNQTSELQLVAPAGGAALPRRLGAFGVPVHRLQPAEAPAAGTPPSEEAAGPEPARPFGERLAAGAETAGQAVTTALRALERRLVALTRLDIDTICWVAAGLFTLVFVACFTWQTWTTHQRYGSFGFDVGIYDQGTWLLSRGDNPFVTISGLNLFGDHASYILLLVAPLYRLWADPRLLLLLQVVALATPALVIHRLAAGRLGHPGYGLAAALAYLLYPAMQWAATWQFHPETFAAAFLAVAVLAAEERKPVLLTVSVALALLCKEDVGLIVAGLGVLLWITRRPVWGKRLVFAGVGWFLLASFVLVPLANGRGTPALERNYGIGGDDPVSAVVALPGLAVRLVTNAFSDGGLAYLALLLLPLALLPVLGWRTLIPVFPPLMLNLAATNTYQQKITFQYAATSAPFLVMAAAAGLAVIAARRRSLAAPVALLLVAAALIADLRAGPALWSATPALGQPPAQAASRDAALARIPAGDAVSAQYNLVTHLAHREQVYEFPNPFRTSNWGLKGDRHDPADTARVRWVLIEPGTLDEEDQATLRGLREGGGWKTVFEQKGVLLIERTGAAP
jgi:uncharacterized membrane protein